MALKYAKYAQEFREAALSQVQTARSVWALCGELGVSRQLLYQRRASAERNRQRKRSVSLGQ